MKEQFNNKKNYNKKKGSKPVTKWIELDIGGITPDGVCYNTQDFIETLAPLTEADVFSKLIVNVRRDKSLLASEDGIDAPISIGRILDIDYELLAVKVLFFNKAADYANNVLKNTYVIMPSVRMSKDGNSINTITGFNLVDKGVVSDSVEDDE